MASSSFLPLSCPTCTTVRLELVRPGDATTCPSCGSPTAVVPGESYGEHDVPLFERIESVVGRARLSRGDLEAVVHILNDWELRMRSPETVVLLVLDFLPGLDFLLPAIYATKPVPRIERATLIRATGTIKSLVLLRLRRQDCQVPA